MLLTFPVCNIELVTSKINLHLTSRDVSVVVRQVVGILIITDMLLELRVRIAFPVCNIELVTSKINLHLTSRDVSVVVRQVVGILIITDMLLELRVRIAVGMLLEIFLV